MLLFQDDDTGDESDSKGKVEEDVGESSKFGIQRVWILCGGEGSDSTASLASGIHAYHELQKEQDMLVGLLLSLKWNELN